MEYNLTSSGLRLTVHIDAENNVCLCYIPGGLLKLCLMFDCGSLQLFPSAIGEKLCDDRMLTGGSDLWGKPVQFRSKDPRGHTAPILIRTVFCGIWDDRNDHLNNR
ncbi:hypothetical protein STEG23_006162 [Scotinomys teguina]